MTTVRVDIAPNLLRWAVKRARWDEETVRKRAPKLDAWIDGTARPTLKQVEKFAAATHAPFGMLFLPEPPVEDIPIPDMRTIRDAGVREPSADLLETIYLCQRRQDWYRDDALDSGATPLSFVGSATLSTPAEEAAARIRAALRLDERSVPNWSAAMTDLIERAEALGVLVMVNGIVGSDTHRKLDPEEFRGFALADDIAPLVFINGADTKAAQIFTLVHELAHLWLGCTASPTQLRALRRGRKRRSAGATRSLQKSWYLSNSSGRNGQGAVMKTNWTVWRPTTKSAPSSCSPDSGMPGISRGKSTRPDTRPSASASWISWIPRRIAAGAGTTTTPSCDALGSPSPEL